MQTTTPLRWWCRHCMNFLISQWLLILDIADHINNGCSTGAEHWTTIWLHYMTWESHCNDFFEPSPQLDSLLHLWLANVLSLKSILNIVPTTLCDFQINYALHSFTSPSLSVDLPHLWVLLVLTHPHQPNYAMWLLQIASPSHSSGLSTSWPSWILTLTLTDLTTLHDFFKLCSPLHLVSSPSPPCYERAFKTYDTIHQYEMNLAPSCIDLTTLRDFQVASPWLPWIQSHNSTPSSIACVASNHIPPPHTLSRALTPSRSPPPCNINFMCQCV